MSVRLRKLYLYNPSARKIYKVRMYGINRYRAGTARIYACGDSRLRGLRSRKPIGFRQWVVHLVIKQHENLSIILPEVLLWKSRRRLGGMNSGMPNAPAWLSWLVVRPLPGACRFTVKVPPPDRRHKFRDAKCACRTFMDGGASATGRMQVYFINPPLIGGMSSGMPNAPAWLSWMVVRPLPGACRFTL